MSRRGDAPCRDMDERARRVDDDDGHAATPRPSEHASRPGISATAVSLAPDRSMIFTFYLPVVSLALRYTRKRSQYQGIEARYAAHDISAPQLGRSASRLATAFSPLPFYRRRRAISPLDISRDADILGMDGHTGHFAHAKA